MNTRGFSKDAKRIIGEFEALGWTFTVSSKGHAIGRSPDGQTTESIAKNLSNARAKANAEASLRRAQRAAEMTGVLAESRQIIGALGGAGRAANAVTEPQTPTDAILVGALSKRADRTFDAIDEEAADAAEQAALREAMESEEVTRPHSRTANAIGRIVRGGFVPVHYECVKCGERYDTARGVGQHSRFCVRGNVPLPESRPDGAPRLAPPEQVAVEAEPVRVMPDPTPDPVLDQIRALVAPDLIAERDALRAERDHLAETLARVEADLDALRALADAIRVAP